MATNQVNASGRNTGNVSVEKPLPHELTEDERKHITNSRTASLAQEMIKAEREEHKNDNNATVLMLETLITAIREDIMAVPVEDKGEKKYVGIDHYFKTEDKNVKEAVFSSFLTDICGLETEEKSKGRGDGYQVPVVMFVDAQQRKNMTEKEVVELNNKLRKKTLNRFTLMVPIAYYLEALRKADNLPEEQTELFEFNRHEVFGTTVDIRLDCWGRGNKELKSGDQQLRKQYSIRTGNGGRQAVSGTNVTPTFENLRKQATTYLIGSHGWIIKSGTGRGANNTQPATPASSTAVTLQSLDNFFREFSGLSEEQRKEVETKVKESKTARYAAFNTLIALMDMLLPDTEVSQFHKKHDKEIEKLEKEAEEEQKKASAKRQQAALDRVNGQKKGEEQTEEPKKNGEEKAA